MVAELARNASVVLDAARLIAEETASSGKLGARTAEVSAALAALPVDLAELDAERAALLLSGIAGLKLTGFGRSDSEIRVKEAAKLAREAAARVQDAAAAEAQAPLTQAVLSLLAELGERIRKAKRLARVMSFRDAAEFAVDLLRRRRRPELLEAPHTVHHDRRVPG